MNPITPTEQNSGRLAALGQRIGQMGLSPDLSGRHYSQGYTFNQMNVTGLIIGILRLFFIVQFSRHAVHFMDIGVNSLPIMSCTIMLVCMLTRVYWLPIYFSFFLFPILLFFVICYQHDRGMIAYFIPYLVYPFYFLHKQWKIIASFAMSALFLLGSFTVEVFHGYPVPTHFHNLPLELFSATGALVICFIGLYSIKVQVWQYEEKILRQKTELETMNSEIRIEKEKLAENNWVKDKLFSIISHDLRIPIMSLSLLIKDNDNEASLANLNLNIPELRAELKKTSQLFDNLLDWSSLQMRGNRVPFEPIDMAQIAANVKGTLHYRALEKGIQINIAIANPAIYGDGDMIEIILRNLVSNAIKFTQAQGVISITGCMEQGIYRLQVEDNGIGIEPSILKKILINDFYTSNGTSRETGTGLGLFICRDLLEKCGGGLSIVSIAGKGTKVAVSLPSRQSAATAQVQKVHIYKAPIGMDLPVYGLNKR